LHLLPAPESPCICYSHQNLLAFVTRTRISLHLLPAPESPCICYLHKNILAFVTCTRISLHLLPALESPCICYLHQNLLVFVTCTRISLHLLPAPTVCVIAPEIFRPLLTEITRIHSTELFFWGKITGFN